MKKINLYEIKTQLSRYIEMVEAGETVIVCKRNVPVAEIRPIAPKTRKRPELGWATGTYRISEEFDRMSRTDRLSWEGDSEDPLRKYRPAHKPRKK